MQSDMEDLSSVAGFGVHSCTEVTPMAVPQGMGTRTPAQVDLSS